MQCTLLPTKVCKEMDKINRNFLWRETAQKRKFHLLSWQTVTKPKWLGGLGIKKSLHWNKALLAKHLWHIRTNPNELHALMLKNKYPQEANASRCKSPIWASLCKVKSICDTDTRWFIHNENTTNFWHDNWTGSGPLRNLIHVPLNRNKHTLKICDTRDMQKNWSFDVVSFVLPTKIINTICAIPRPFFSDQNDLLTWNHSPNGLFNRSSTYNISLELPNTPSPHSTASWKWLWKVCTIPCILSFLWLASHDHLPTKALLHERHILQDNLCPLCHASVASTLHILRDCSQISPIWANLTH